MEFDLSKFWPIQVYNFLGRYGKVNSINNLCDLAKALIDKVVVLLIGGLILSWTAWSLAHFFMYWMWGIPLLFHIPMSLTAITFYFSLICILSVILILLIAEGGSKVIHSNVVTEAYRGWKDKYCPTVRWIDSSKDS